MKNVYSIRCDGRLTVFSSLKKLIDYTTAIFENEDAREIRKAMKDDGWFLSDRNEFELEESKVR